VLPMLLMLVAFGFLFKTGPEAVGLEPFQEVDEDSAARDLALAEQIRGKGFFYPYKLVFGEPKMIAFCLISSISGIGHYGLLTWIPSYFAEVMGLSVKEGIFSAILLPAGQALAMFGLPFITDKVFKGRREPVLVLAAIISFLGMMAFPFIHSRRAASLLLLVVGSFGTVTGVIWAIAGDMGGRALSSTVAGVLDWAVYMGAAIQASVFGFVKDHFGWPAIFIVIGCLYIIMLALTLVARRMKTHKL
jgi:OPA family sugar phosphate sensor protein UhpC-like MFS transporter